MNELFDKKEVNPTVRMMVSMSKMESMQLKKFAEKMGISVAALIRLATKNYIAMEGKKYETN